MTIEIAGSVEEEPCLDWGDHEPALLPEGSGMAVRLQKIHPVSVYHPLVTDVSDPGQSSSTLKFPQHASEKSDCLPESTRATVREAGQKASADHAIKHDHDRARRGSDTGGTSLDYEKSYCDKNLPLPVSRSPLSSVSRNLNQSDFEIIAGRTYRTHLQ